MVGVWSASSVLAVNVDPVPPVFSQAHVGIVAHRHDLVPLLEGGSPRRLRTTWLIEGRATGTPGRAKEHPANASASRCYL
jgi:hypothetical protein